ncbi:hypothetical protein [Ideonella sp.]|uniref:hypothetical protein n=1 Tax=Ideonella sp. TaxID=1929293 RepID=UPI0035B1164B
MSLLRHPIQGHATLPRPDRLHVEPPEIADRLNTLEQLVESFGPTPEIITALTDGLAELQAEQDHLTHDDTHRMQSLWGVVARHADDVRFTPLKKRSRWFGARADKPGPNG